MKYEDFLGLLKNRRTIRHFKPDPLPKGAIEKILEAGRWAMSGGNGQPWEFLVVTDRVTKAKVGAIINGRQERHWALEQTREQRYRHPGHFRPGLVPDQVRMVNEAPALIILLGDPRTFQATVIGNQFFSGEHDIFHMNLGNSAMIMNLAAASLGLGAAWQTIDRPSEHQLKELLGIPLEYKIYVQIPVGYPVKTPPPQYRRTLKEVAHYGKYDKSKYRTHDEIREWLAQCRLGSLPSYDVRKPAQSTIELTKAAKKKK
ncbi:MAG: nitroreductase family protein [Dehalococcoidia bacterium]|nr:nitroreductase family protein [Dehalococcoidia bacterium]